VEGDGFRGDGARYLAYEDGKEGGMMLVLLYTMALMGRGSDGVSLMVLRILLAPRAVLVGECCEESLGRV
jgi:hypothetical protein